MTDEPNLPKPPGPTEPVGATAATPQPARRSHAWRWVGAGALLLVLLLGAAFGAAWWALRSESGSAWLLSHVPGLEVRQPHGALLGDFGAAGVELRVAGVGTLQIDRLGWKRLEVGRAPAGLWLRIAIAELQAARVDWQSAAPTSSAPASAPASLALPLEIDIAALHIGTLRLEITAFASGSPDSSSLYARYRVTNTGRATATPTLFLAVRPFQVNPSWQFLATQGGVANVAHVAWEDSLLRVNDSLTVVPLTAPSAVGAATFDGGGTIEALRAGSLTPSHDVRDATESASAAMSYPLVIKPGATRDVYVLVPFHEHGAASRPFALDADAARFAEVKLADAKRSWEERLNRVTIALPPSASRISNTLRAQLAYILINDHGVQLHPGPRSYARSWIRDGSMIGAALLRLHHPEQVRAFLEWYAPFQFASGKVPCCVDARGADPVPENDSHGELIYAIADYFRYSGDTAFLRQMWPHVTSAVSYMDSLRALRLTAAYSTGNRRAFRGLFPESISHEGYSAQPMHSYWDDLFGLRGYIDATYIATVLGHASEARDYAAKRDAFRSDIMASYRASMAAHHIDFLPGSVELGDFDATSTTVGVAPVGELASLPDTALRRTFDKYWENSEKRRSGAVAWDAYTPYELRTVGTFVRLGEKQRALSMLDFFFQGQRPAAWRQWAEVVWHDRDTPKFIGDMPHTWVGSDYIRSVLDMFAYDRASDSALVVGAGIAERWVRVAPGVKVRGLGTPYGPIDFDIRARGDSVVAHIAGALRVPPGGIAFRSPVDGRISRARVDGRTVTPSSNGEVVVRQLPATIILTIGRTR